MVSRTSTLVDALFGANIILLWLYSIYLSPNFLVDRSQWSHCATLSQNLWLLLNLLRSWNEASRRAEVIYSVWLEVILRVRECSRRLWISCFWVMSFRKEGTSLRIGLVLCHLSLQTNQTRSCHSEIDWLVRLLLVFILTKIVLVCQRNTPESALSKVYSRFCPVQLYSFYRMCESKKIFYCLCGWQ